MPMPVSRTAMTIVVRLRARLDDDGDAAGFGEFDRVADQVENHLAQPRGVADTRDGRRSST